MTSARFAPRNLARNKFRAGLTVLARGLRGGTLGTLIAWPFVRVVDAVRRVA